MKIYPYLFDVTLIPKIALTLNPHSHIYKCENEGRVRARGREGKMRVK